MPTAMSQQHGRVPQLQGRQGTFSQNGGHRHVIARTPPESPQSCPSRNRAELDLRQGLVKAQVGD